MIHIIIVEDQGILRSTLNARLKYEKEVEVAGCTSSGSNAVLLCDMLKPDIVLMDIRLSEFPQNSDGIDAARIIKSRNAQIKIIFLTTFWDYTYLSRCLDKVGSHYLASGYLLKDIDDDELIKAIYRCNDNFVLFDGLSLKFLSTDEVEYFKKKFTLTEREIKIIELVTQGKSNKEIASRIFLSEGSVSNILTEIMGKLNVKNRIELAVYAVTNKLLEN